MRKIQLFIASSLDNYIARLNGAVDWLFTDADYGLTEFYTSVDTVLMGRKTHDFALSQGQSSFAGKKNYVFSRSRSDSEHTDVEFVSENLREFVERLRQSPGKNIWLVGGADLAESFLDELLVDELILTVHPVILGSGIPLFRGKHRQIDLNLMGCKTYESGIIQIHYAVK